MNKSVRIHLLVITTVVAIFVFTGIWYLRPGVPNELLEQARTRQLQPLLEIDAPIRKPVVESVAKTTIDKKALAEELLPSLTDQVASSLEESLYARLQAQFASDEAFIAQISAKLEKSLNLGSSGQSAAIPQGLQADFTQQLEALRTELLGTFGEGQSSFFFQIEEMFDGRLNRFEEDLKAEMEAYVPQLVDRMIPSLVEMIVVELDKDKEAYLAYLADQVSPYLAEDLSEEELALLYTAYRDQAVEEIVPAILTAMEEPAREEVAAMVKSTPVATEPVPAPPPSVTSSVKKSEAEPVAAKPAVPAPPAMKSVQSAVVESKPIIRVPSFGFEGPEVFVDPTLYEEKRTEIRTKAIQEVLLRINTL